MSTNIEVLRELDELVEAARLLGVTQAKRGFGCYTYEDSRFERAMYESIDKRRAALLAAVDGPDTQAAEIERLRAEVERLNRILGRIVEGDGDSNLTIRAGADAFAAAREYLLREQEEGK